MNFYAYYYHHDTAGHWLADVGISAVIRSTVSMVMHSLPLGMALLLCGVVVMVYLYVNRRGW